MSSLCKLGLSAPLVVAALSACGSAASSGVPTTPAPPAGDAPVVEIPRSVPTSAPSAVAAAEPASDGADAGAEGEQAQEFGMIGLLNTTGDAGTWGSLVGDGGDAFGAGGLGLQGAGQGGGGRGEGIGLGSIGSIGHGAGTGTGQGFGNGQGRLGGSHANPPPKLVMGATTVNGRLPPEVIQRIVRQNFGRYRLCYEKGLAKDPKLAGKITVKFVIGKDGATTSASNAGSDLPDGDVIACVVRGFSTLSFPAPEGGIVVVQYPIRFSPGEDDAKKSP